MVGLVTSDHLLAVFIFWELPTITSYLLIGYDDHNAGARSSALHAALVTGAGGLAMLGGMVLLGQTSGTFLISEIVASPPAGSATIAVAWALLLVGAVSKSAQFLLHGWLPGSDGRPHLRQRVPPLRNHGQGRNPPGRVRRVRRPLVGRLVAADDPRIRLHDDGGRGVAGAPPERPQAIGTEVRPNREEWLLGQRDAPAVLAAGRVSSKTLFPSS